MYIYTASQPYIYIVSQVALLVKNLHAKARLLSWEDSLEEGMATPSRILAWRIPWTEGAWWAAVHEVAELDTIEHTHTQTYK